jgi:hypothetical protein
MRSQGHTVVVMLATVIVQRSVESVHLFNTQMKLVDFQLLRLTHLASSVSHLCEQASIAHAFPSAVCDRNWYIVAPLVRLVSCCEHPRETDF